MTVNSNDYKPYVSNIELDDFSEFIHETGEYHTSLYFLHINARSLVNKFDSFKTCITQLGHSPAIIAISETWLKTIDSEYYRVPGYASFFSCRNDGIGGGVALYINNAFKHNLISVHNNGHFSVWVEISNFGIFHKAKFAVYYKPPSEKLNEFLSTLENDLITCSSIPTFIAGDFNINTLDTSSLLYKIICNSNCFHILNNIPTRVTADSQSLIDHFLTNVTNKKFVIYTINSFLSDHNAILLEMSNPDILKRKECYVRIDHPMASEYLKVRCDLLYPFHPSSDVNNKLGLTVSALKESFVSASTTVKLKKKLNTKYSLTPWATPHFLDLVRERDRIFKKYKRKRSNVLIKEQLNLINNRITSLKRSLSSEYFKAKFSECSGDNKTTWKNINAILGRSTFKPCVTEIVHEGTVIHDPRVIAELFCQHFSTVGLNLTSHLTNSRMDINSLNSLIRVPSSIYMGPVVDLDLINVINNLKIKSPGHDNISTETLKTHKNLLAPLLTTILNQCFSEGVYPDLLKIGKVIPLFKSGDSKNVNNYRPISILSSINKVFETVIKRRLVKFLEVNNILNACQFGFRKNRSTVSAALKLVDSIRKTMDKTKIAGALFIDLCKAFDMVDHEILLQKMEYYGIRGTALNLFNSYLSNRSQYVEIDKIKSPLVPTTLGVPQGSVLGPILFLIYINDLGNLHLNGEPTLFADDTVISYSHHDSIQQLSTHMQNDLNTLNNYFKINRLVLNTDKTKFIIFKSPQYKHKTNFKLLFGKYDIVNTTSIKYLGLHLDVHLNWKTHVDALIKKILPVAGVLKRLNSLDSLIKKIIYDTLVNSHLQYMSPLWGAANKSTLHPLQIIQNKCIKSVYSLPQLTPSKHMYINYNILPVKCIYEYNLILLLQFHPNESQAPTPIHYTRNYNGKFLCSVRTEYGKLASYYHGYKLLNSLSLEVTNCSNLILFKKKLKIHMLEKLSNWSSLLPY